jgi:ABC-2 type transport system permease protein
MSRTPAPNDRGVWRIVARREFVERIRDRGFQISTGVTVGILLLVIVLSSFAGGPKEFDVGVIGPDATEVARLAQDTAGTLGLQVHVRTYRDAAAATAAVRDGSADAAIVEDDHIVVKSDPPQELVGVIQAVSLRLRSQRALEDAGLSTDEANGALSQPPLPVQALEPRDERQQQNAGIAFIGVLALYGQLFAYGYWVAAGVIEEKSSRVVEVLLATVRPSQLLRGKILGIGVLGLLQLFTIGAAGLLAGIVLGTLDFPTGALATIGLVIVWFVLGYFFYAGLFACAGSLVSRQEDLQSTMTPLTIVIVGSFFIGINAVQNPDSTLATVASLLPPSAPLVMPTRIVLGEARLAEALLSAAISIAATIALIPVATRVYSRAVLRTGKVKIRSVLGRDAT